MTNILLSKPAFLNADGITDGGCTNQDPIPSDDPDGMCPKGKSDPTCNALFLGIGIALALVIIGIPLLCVLYCTHSCCFKRHPETKKTAFQDFREKTMGEPKVNP